VVLDVPLERTEPADEEQHHADAEVERSRSREVKVARRSRDVADAEVREDDAHPDFGRERLEEREHARLVFDRLLFKIISLITSSSSSSSSFEEQLTKRNLDNGKER